MNKRQMKSEKKETIHILQYNFLQESKFKVKFFILKCIKFFLNSIYIYIPKKEIIRLSIARKEKKIGFWNNKSFIADNNNDENRSDNI